MEQSVPNIDPVLATIAIALHTIEETARSGITCLFK